jgi:hypothetical protein
MEYSLLYAPTAERRFDAARGGACARYAADMDKKAEPDGQPRLPESLLTQFEKLFCRWAW